MRSNDPRILIDKLTVLCHELKKWSYFANELCGEAGSDSRRVSGDLEMERTAVNVTRNWFEDDPENVRNAEGILSEQYERCMQAVDRSYETAMKVNSLKRRVTIALSYWNGQLKLADEQLRHAVKLLAGVQKAHFLARRRMEEASNELKMAEVHLQKCRLSERGRCKKEEEVVRDAVEKYRDAETWLNVLQMQLMEAEEEVEQAKRRAFCCIEALKYCEAAERLVVEAEEQTTQAITNAERSFEHVTVANDVLVEIQEKLDEEEVAIETMLEHVSMAEARMQEVGLHLHRAEEFELSAQSYASKAMQEIEDRIHTLQRFNQHRLGKLILAGVIGISVTTGHIADHKSAWQQFEDMKQPTQTVIKDFNWLAQAQENTIELANKAGDAIEEIGVELLKQREEDQKKGGKGLLVDENEWLWLTKRQSRFLQEYLNEIRGIWSDQAAQDIMNFFLLPYQDENAQMERSFEKVYSVLQEFKHPLEAAKEQRLRASAASNSIKKSLKTLTNEINEGECEYEKSLENEMVGASYLPGIEDYMRRAYLMEGQYVGSNGGQTNDAPEYRTEQRTQPESVAEQNDGSRTNWPSSEKGDSNERFKTHLSRRPTQDTSTDMG